jgi:hypothetical protein
MNDLDEINGNEKSFIKKLHESSREDLMELIYDSIVNHKMGALQHDAPISEKIEGIQNVLNFFKEREEYEKCGELKKIIDELSC